MALDSQAKKIFKQVGTRPRRPDGVDKVTGRAMYGADATAPGMLFARVLRSPHAHAVIKSIDASAALAQKGVKAVVTSADFGVPEDLFIRDVQDNCMARGKVLQIDTATGLYERPNCREVAEFIGTMNLIPGRIATAERASKAPFPPDRGPAKRQKEKCRQSGFSG